MKTVLFSVLFLISYVVNGQSVNKAWIDNQAKLSNPAFEPANARYFINNILCDAVDLDVTLRNWSPAYVNTVSVLDSNIGMELYPAAYTIWVVIISGIPDPSFKATTMGGTMPSKKKKRKSCTNE